MRVAVKAGTGPSGEAWRGRSVGPVQGQGRARDRSRAMGHARTHVRVGGGVSSNPVNDQARTGGQQSQSASAQTRDDAGVPRTDKCQVVSVRVDLEAGPGGGGGPWGAGTSTTKCVKPGVSSLSTSNNSAWCQPMSVCSVGFSKFKRRWCRSMTGGFGRAGRDVKMEGDGLSGFFMFLWSLALG